MLVVEGRSEGLGLAQQCQDPPKIAEQAECRAQGESEVDGLRKYIARSGRCGRVLSACSKYPLPRGRPSAPGLCPPPAGIRQGLVPHLAPQGMLRQPFHLVTSQPAAIPARRLQRLDNARVQRAPAPCTRLP